MFGMKRPGFLVLVSVGLLVVGCGSSESSPPTELDQLVEDYEDGLITRDEFRAAIDALPDSELANALTADIGETTLLKARAEPYTIAADLTVKDGAILVIQEGAEVVIAAEVNLFVEGRLYAVGSALAPVKIGAAGTDHFGEVELQGSPNQLVFVEFDRPDRALDIRDTGDERTLIESCRFNAWLDVAISIVDAGNVHIFRSSFGFETDELDIAGETVRARRNGVITIEESEFAQRLGYKDVLDLQDCNEGEYSIILHNRFDGGEDDAVDLDGCSAFVIGNRISNFQPRDLSAMVAGVNGGAVTGDQETTHAIIINNVIDNCFHGIGFKNGAQPIMLNNTITNSNIGITLYQSKQGNPVPHGVVINNVLFDNVGWLNGGVPQDILLNGKWWPSYNQVDDIQATIDARYNITASLPAPYEGEGNLNDDPLIEFVNGIPTLMTGSPAIDSGLGTLEFDGVPMQDILDYLATDVVGTPRTLADIDRGAVEAD